MGLKVIEQLEATVKTLADELKKEKEASAKKLEELEKSFAEKLEERKTEFGEEAQFSAKDLDKLKRKGADLYLNSMLMGKPVTEMAGYKDIAADVEKAIVPADVPAWLAEEFSSQILEELELELELKIENLFAKVNMPDNRNQFSIPAIVGDVKAYLIAPGEDAIESAIASAKVTFETTRIKTLVGVADQADHESVVMMTDIVRARLVKALAKASEDAIINGDTSIADNNDVRKAFDGLLKLAIAAGNTVDGGGNAPTAATIAATRQVLGVYGINVADLVIVASFSTAFKLLELDEVITVDKYGPAATIITGELGKIWGIPIVVSEYVRTDLDAGGQNPGTGDKTALLVVNKGYFAVADRGNITVEVERRAVSSVNMYVGFRDYDFKMLSVGFTPVAALVNLA
jgi:HK97 family phage major capsid protein